MSEFIHIFARSTEVLFGVCVRHCGLRGAVAGDLSLHLSSIQSNVSIIGFTAARFFQEPVTGLICPPGPVRSEVIFRAWKRQM